MSRSFALTPSTALLAVTALADIAECALDLKLSEVRSFAGEVLERIEAQPDTVTHLTAVEVLQMREQLVQNCAAWAKRSPDFLSNADPGDEQEDDHDDQ